MSYIITEAGDDYVTVWDGKTMDPDHPGHKAGEMQIFIGPHFFRKGQLVEVLVSLAQTAGDKEIEARLAAGAGRNAGRQRRYDK